MCSEKIANGFNEKFLFAKLFRTFSMAIQPSKLIIGFSAITLICLAGWIMDFSNTVVVNSNILSQRQRFSEDSELHQYVTNPENIQKYIKENSHKNLRQGVFKSLWGFIAGRLNNAINLFLVFDFKGTRTQIGECFKALEWAVRYHYAYCMIFWLIVLAVISIAGGSICRISALQFARGEKPGLTEAVRFSLVNFKSLFGAPLIPIGIIVFIGLFIYVLGLIGRIPWLGELIVAISTPLALVAGALMAVFSIAASAGFNLMFPAVAYDGADFLDTFGRSFNYLIKKPWRIGFYSFVAVVYGIVCYTFIRLFAFILLLVTYRFLEFGMGTSDTNAGVISNLSTIWAEPKFINLLGTSNLQNTNMAQDIAIFIINLSVLVVIGLVVSFVISFYFSANTIIYSLMRYHIDGNDIEEVYCHSDDIQTEDTPPDE